MKDDRRSRRTRKLVIEALVDLLAERPYDEITIQAILDRADIGRATFYNHFRDKLDVVDAMVGGMFEAIAGPPNPTTGHPRLDVLEIFRHAAGRQRSLRAMLDTPGGEVFWRQAQAAWVTALQSAVEASRAAEGSRVRLTDHGVPAAVVAEFNIGAFAAVLRWWLRNGMPYPPEQMAAMTEALLPPSVRDAPISRGSGRASSEA